MNTLRQAAQKAVQVMDDHMMRADTDEFYEAKEALRQALAQEVTTQVTTEVTGDVAAVNMSQERVDEKAKRGQEPVAFRNKETGEFCTGGFMRKEWLRWMPLYTSPQKQWIGLTDEERRQILLDDPIDWIAAIEDKLKEKNT